MSNVMSKAEQERVVDLGKAGWSLRRIEAATGCRRETAGKYLRLANVAVRSPGRWGHGAAAAGGEASKPAIEVSARRNMSMASQCTAHRDRIAAAVDKGVCAKVIWEELRADGVKVGYASVKRFVRRLKAEARSSSTAPPVGTIQTGPGKEAQVDYGQGPLVRDPRTGRMVRSRLFVMTLGWSRKAVYLLTLSSSSDEWCGLHERAFRALGGAAEVIVLDNLAEGVKVPDYCDPVLNPMYAQTLAHYGTVGIPSRVRDPDRKGKVERGVGYAQLRLEHRTFASLGEAQAFLDDWVATVADVRVHGTTKRVVAEHFVEEQPFLKALPVEPCRRYTFVRRKVKSTGEIEVETQRFQVPASHVNAWVQVQFNADVVRVVDEASGQLLVEHLRKPAPPSRAAAPEAGKGLSSSPLGELVQRGHQLGKNIGALCAAIAAVDNGELAVRRVTAVLRSTTNHGVDHVETGCRVAIQAGAPTYRCVRAWLDHHRPPQLAQVDSLIRNLSAYRDVAARLASSATTTTTQETA
jgi:hypothetical protein